MNDNKDNKFLWKHVKKLKETQNDHSLSQELVLNSQHCHETVDMIEILNYYFTTVSEKLKDEHPQESIPFGFRS